MSPVALTAAQLRAQARTYDRKALDADDAGRPALCIAIDHPSAVVNPDHRTVFPDHPVFRLVVAVSAIQQALDLLPD